MIEKIKALISILKNDPSILLRKTKLIVLLPLALFFLILKRVKYQKFTVLMVKVSTSSLIKKYNEDYNLVWINKPNEMLHVFLLRAELEKNMAAQYIHEVNQRFIKGNQCVILKEGDTIASYLFISYNEAYIDAVDYNLSLLPDQAAVYDVYTFPEFRGRSLYPRLFFLVSDILKERGYNEILLWLMPHNLRSIKSHLKIGFNEVSATICRKEFLGLSRISTDFSKHELKGYLGNE